MMAIGEKESAVIVEIGTEIGIGVIEVIGIGTGSTSKCILVVV